MSHKLQIVLSLMTVLFLIGTLGFIKKKGLDLNHSIKWFFGAVLMFFIAIFPQPVVWLADIAGIETPSNFVFSAVIAFLLVTALSQSAAISRHHMRIKRLVQSLAILENKVDELTKKIEKLNKVNER